MHGTLARDDAFDLVGGHINAPGEFGGAQAHGFEVVFEEDLARVCADTVLRKHYPSMIVDDAYVVGVSSVPCEHHAPLVIDTDAMEAGELTGKGLKAISLS